MSRQRWVAGIWVLACAYACNALASGLDREIQFDIPPQALSPALILFSGQADVQVITKAQDVSGGKTSGVKGLMSASAALKQLLDGTGFAYLAVGENTVEIAADALASEGASADAGVQEIARLAQAERTGPAADEKADHSDAAQAATQSEELDEIVVTAQKRIERLQDVPVPVTVIGAAALTRSGQLRLEDYFSKVPGLSMAPIGGNSGQPTLSIRGISTIGLGNPSVGVMVDDVPFGATINPGTTPTVADIDPGDLERIEVLRGPQGTLYGAASMGGLLKYVTVDPSTEKFGGRVQAGYTSISEGSDPGYNYRGTVNVPLGDTFAVRASAFKLRDPGYVDNVLTGKRDVNRRDAEGGRISALWQASARFSVKVSALTQDSDRDGPSDISRALLLSTGNLQQSGLPRTGVYDRHSEAYSAKMVGTLGPVEMTSITGYNIDESFDNLDTSFYCAFGLPCPTGFSLAAPTTVDTTKFTQEVRASIPLGHSVNWLMGLFYGREVLDTRIAINSVNTSTGATSGTPLHHGTTTSTYTEYAAFTNLTFDITDRFDVQLGGRLSDNSLDYSLHRDPGVLNGPNPVQPPFVSSSDTPFTYLLTPRFKVAPDVMAYARFASGYRPGGNNNCIIAVPCTYEPDATRNYELGFKGSVLDRMLTFDVSLYRIDWQDIQLTFSFNGNPFLPFQGNGGRARSQGVELSVEVEPVNGLTLAAWVVRGEAELTEDLPVTSGLGIGLKGDRLPNSSSLSANFSADQKFPLSDRATGFVGLSVSYVGDRDDAFRGSLQSPRANFPSYVEADLRAGVELGSWTVDAFVDNITDKRAFLAGDPQTSANFYYSRPRMMGLNVSKTF